MIYRRMTGFPRWRVRGPFEELERMRSRMDRLLDGFSNRPYRSSHAGVYPPINLTEDKDTYFVRAELPGVKSEDLDIHATGKNLSISGKREIPPAEEGVKYHRRERDGGSFSRMINLADGVEPDMVEAKLTNGILTVKVPKAEALKPRRASIG